MQPGLVILLPRYHRILFIYSISTAQHEHSDTPHRRTLTMSPSVAVLGHRGWLGQTVVPTLVEAGLSTKVMGRQGSPLGELPHGVESVSLDWADTAAFVEALKGVDVVMYVHRWFPG